MLRLAGEIASREKYETLSYTPGILDTTDLEAGTATMAPVTRPAIGAAQYNRALALTPPADSRFAITNLGARLNVNIAGMGTAGHLYLSVRMDADDAAHELFSEDWNTAGSKLDGVNLNAANKAAVFHAVRDGAAHTFYFCFWADQPNQVQIDTVEMWLGVGAYNCTAFQVVLSVSHTGLILFSGSTPLKRIGTGNMATSLFLQAVNSMPNRVFQVSASATPNFNNAGLLASNGSIGISVNDATVATDLLYLDYINIVLRSEQ